MRLILAVGAVLLSVSCRKPEKLELHGPKPLGLPIFVGISNSPRRLLHMERPLYPAHLRYLGVQTVQLKCRILEGGSVSEIMFLNGPPELVPLARAAVARWRYEPFRIYDFMTGENTAQAAITVIDLRFEP
ncbi:MAG: hypothetical protein ABSE86_16390 [Bryobacteraceae bacterium]